MVFSYYGAPAMRVYLSTVIRGASLEQGGELIALDWDAKKVIARRPLCPPDPRIHDPNPRGGTRGGRGIVLLPDELLVATYHSLLGFDYELKPTRIITNKNFAGLHELKLVEDGLWVTSTPLGVLLKVDLEGNSLQEWWAHDDLVVQREFGAQALPIQKSGDNRLAGMTDSVMSKLHLNNVEVYDGRVYVALNNQGAILRLFPTEVLLHHPSMKGCHNGLVARDGELLLNNSHDHMLIVFDMHTGEIRRQIDLASFSQVAPLLRARQYQNVSWPSRLKQFLLRKRLSRPLFTRGMCLLDDTRVMVGVSPASVLEVDYKRGRLIDLMQCSEAVNECVHGLEAIPSVDFPGPGNDGRART